MLGPILHLFLLESVININQALYPMILVYIPKEKQETNLVRFTTNDGSY